MRNFAFPYFSRDIAEFWRRWHISLSTWFRDYVYIPVGGSRGSVGKKIRNIFIIFVLSGFWHGANWTFIAWGALNAIYFTPLMLMNKNRRYTNNVAEGKIFPNLKEAFQIGITFFMTLIAWVFFRSESINEAARYIANMLSTSLFTLPEIFPLKILLFIALLIIAEWFQRNKQHGLQLSRRGLPKVVRWGVYYGIVATILYLGGQQQEFIYFQF